jgi:acetylornithine deacetylase
VRAGKIHSVNTRELLDTLIGFPTVSRDSNLDLIEFVRIFLSARGVPSQLFMDATGKKANLFATVGPTDRGGIMLSGHTDVVPVDGQDWSTDPFRMVERRGALYGRGTADMKGFIASALAAAERATRRTLRMPLHLALSYDEEIGCVGVRSMIDAMTHWNVRPRLCIVGEPTMLRPAVGHKGKSALRTVCTGMAVHSSLAPQGVNAIHTAADLVQRVRSLQSRIESSGKRDSDFDIPYTTLHVGIIHGGVALNIVPDHCELELEIRNLPDEPAQSFIDAIRAEADQLMSISRSRISMNLINDYPPLSTDGEAEVVALVSNATGERRRIKVGFGSEAGLFSQYLSIPCVVCGPGSINDAHRPDEFVRIEQLERCDAMLEAVLDRLSSG